MESPSAAFRASYPIDFQLYDQDHHYALYIDENSSAHVLTIEFHNVSVQEIAFQNGQGDVASAENYHFELQFKPGTLSPNTINLLQDVQKKGQLLDSEEWDLFMPSGLDVVDHLSLYLLYRGENTSFQPDERRQLSLNRITAAAGDGTRGTRVTMKVNQLVYAGQTTPISHTRSHHLSIVNHQGRPNIPLHLSFVGSNRVLNDGGAHPNLKLTLRLRNISPTETVPFTAVTPPRFSITVDTGSLSDEWALCTPEQAHTILLRASYNNNWLEIPEVTGNQTAAPEWHITSEFLGLGELGPHEWIDIELSNFVTNHPTGMANLYVRFENIPGYWDEQAAVSIEKAPLLFINGRVGIGTSSPSQKLEVAGNIVGDNLSVARTNDRRGALFLATSGDFNHALYNNYSNVDGEGAQDSAKWNVFAGLNIRTGSGTQKKTALAIDAYGRVGVGTATPEAKLQIINANQNSYGDTLILGPTNQSNLRLGYDQEYSWIQSHGLKPLALNPLGNNVGIGTSSSEAKLQIINANQNAHGGTLIIGPTNQANLRLGYDQEYSWIQSHGLKPLAINPVGNNVGIGTSEPEAMLHIKGTTQLSGDLRLEGNIYKKAGDWWYLPLELPPVPKIWPAPPPVTAIDAVWRKTSDGRLKHHVRQIDQALAKIAKLRGITFEWNDKGLRHLTRAIETHISAGPDATEQANQQAQTAARQAAYQMLSGSNIGLVAQDVEQVLPELVDTDEAGYKNLRYDLVTALLVEAVKELKAIVEAAIGQSPQPKGM